MRIFVPSAAALLTNRDGHGEGLIAWNVFSELAARGHDVVVCAQRVSFDHDPPFRVVQLPLGRFESLRPLAHAARTRRIFRRLGGRARFDVIHWLYPGEPEETLFIPPRGMPYVIGPLLPQWEGGRGRPSRAGDAITAGLSPLTRWRSRTALRRARVLLATPDARPFDGQVVPPGVDVTRFTADPPVGRTIAYVGRFEQRKGVRELVDAFAQVHGADPAAQLLMAGDGAERSWLVDRIAHLGLESSISLLGPVTPEEVATILDASGVVCIPSHREPYGMVVLEAMAAGRAIVATAEGGPRFLLDDDGARFVPVGDCDALATVLAEVTADEAVLARMGASNRRRVEREFSLTAMVNSLEQVYEAAVAG